MNERAWRPVGILMLSMISLSGGCVSKPKIYRDSWQPASLAESAGLPIVVTHALQVQLEDEQALRDAGAELIGHHASKTEWARRAASTGGTHFVPVVDSDSTVKLHCFGSGAFARCSESPKKARATKIAVLRVEPSNWHLLPPHLIPVDKTVQAAQFSAVRTGCTVEKFKGTVKCRSNWAVSVNERIAKQAAPKVEAHGGESNVHQEAHQQVEAPPAPGADPALSTNL